MASKRKYGGFGQVLERKQILRNINGHVSSGQMLAIIGPSGSGKTTTLDVLAGRRAAEPNASVLLNGHELDSKLFAKRCRCVGKDMRACCRQPHAHLACLLATCRKRIASTQRSPSMKTLTSPCDCPMPA